MKIGELEPTQGELLWVMRRRLGMSQVRLAIKLGVSLDQIRSWEANDMTVPMKPIYTSRSLGDVREGTYIAPLSDREACILLRKRNALTQADIAHALSVSRVWVLKMEKGEVNSSALIKYWR